MKAGNQKKRTIILDREIDLHNTELEWAKKSLEAHLERNGLLVKDLKARLSLLEEKCQNLSSEYIEFRRNYFRIRRMYYSMKNSREYNLGVKIFNDCKTAKGHFRLLFRGIRYFFQILKRRNGNRLSLDSSPSGNVEGVGAPTLFREVLVNDGVAAFTAAVEDSYNRQRDDVIGRYEVAYKAARASRDIEPIQALIWAKKAAELSPNATIYRELAYLYYSIGQITKSGEYAEKWLESSQHEISFKEKIWLKELSSWKELKTGSVPIPRAAAFRVLDQDCNKVFMYLHKSLPFESVGYCTRTHGLLTGLKKYNDFDVHAYTRLGYPSDDLKTNLHVETSSFQPVDIIDDIRYTRIRHHHIGAGLLSIREQIFASADYLTTYLSQQRYGIAHAASNFTNALPVIIAAKKLGIPCVYEVRGLWEVTRGSRFPYWYESEHYSIHSDMEIVAAREADSVITITEALKHELVRRGVDERKVEVVPNAVDLSQFEPRAFNVELAEKLGLKESFVTIGFIGSFVQYEGLDDLVEALKILKDRGIKFQALLVGAGYEENKISKLLDLFGLQNEVKMPGRVPHKEVAEYYSLIDIAPFPRKPQPVCELVSPLKPFEAMAMEKAILVSNVDAMREFIVEGVNGYTFEKGDTLDLANKLEKLIHDEGLRKRLGTQSRSWVAANRNWDVAAKKIVEVYEGLRL